MLSLSLVLAAAAQVPVTTQSLIREMTDLDRLTRRPTYAYKTVEASSYDRASVSPNQEGWFANSDFGKYLRVETREGRREHVMVDAQGPGVALRFWSANPMGSVRFYFDGEAKPRLQARMADLLQRKLAPFGDDFSYVAARGCNLYFPFPFAKSLRVTVAADSAQDKMESIYYQFSIRQYEAGTPVVTFDPTSLGEPQFPLREGPKLEYTKRRLILPARGSQEVTLTAENPSEIRDLTLETLTPMLKVGLMHPRSPENLLKRVEVSLSFDGQETIRVPLPDFFGAGIMPAKLKTLVAEVEESTKMSQFLPMPFRRTAKLKLINHNASDLSFMVDLGTRRNSAANYVLHARWMADTKSSRPMRDLTFLDFYGEGRYVGTVQHVQNPTPGWWGEGDEKISVDGERFPSWIGTGTEDYFGYAWCFPEVFNRPYHAQPRVDGPGNGGQTGNVRWHITDDIPFEQRIQFKMEMWHWEDVPSRFAGTAFFYAKPSAWEAPGVRVADLELIEGPKPPEPVKGAIEAEALTLTKTSGQTELQDYAHLSSGRQLWWRDGQVGGTLELEFRAERAGTFNFITHNCFAVDYGVHELFLNGVSLGTRDFYAPDLKWGIVDWGRVSVKAGANTLSVVARGSNPSAKPARLMFGLDYLLLKG